MALSEQQLKFLTKYLSVKVSPPVATAPDPAQQTPAATAQPSEQTEFSKEDAAHLLGEIAKMRAQAQSALGSPFTEVITGLDKVKSDVEAAQALEAPDAFQSAMQSAHAAYEANVDKLAHAQRKRTDYLPELARSETLKTALEAHPQYNEVEAGDKTPVAETLTKAKQEAARHDYDAALASLEEMDTKRLAARAAADAAGRFAVVLAARKTAAAEFAKFYDGLDWGNAGVPVALKDRYDAAQKLIADAEAEGPATGLAKLDAFPKVRAALRTELGKACTLPWRYNEIETDVAVFTTSPPPPYIVGNEGTELKAHLDRAKAKWDSGDLVGASDIVKVVYDGTYTLLFNRKKAYEECKAKLESYEAKKSDWVSLVSIVGGPDWADACFADFERLMLQAREKFNTCEFGAVYERLKLIDKSAAELNIRDGELDLVQSRIDAKKVPPESVYMAGKFDRIAAIHAEATRLKDAGEYLKAQKCADEIDVLVTSVETSDKLWMADFASKAASLKEGSDDIENWPDWTVQQLTEMIDQWKMGVPEGFTAADGGPCDFLPDRLSEAQAKRDAADAALKLTPTPDFGAAKTLIEEGSAVLKTAAENVLAATAFEEHETAVKAKRDSVTKDTSNTTVYDEGEVLLTEARNAARAHDYSVGATKLIAAGAKFTEAEAKKTLKDAADAADRAFGYVVPANCDMSAITTEMTALNAKKTALTQARAAPTPDTALIARLQQELNDESYAAYVKGIAPKYLGYVTSAESMIAASSTPATHSVAKKELAELRAKMDAAVAKVARGLCYEAAVEAGALTTPIANAYFQVDNCEKFQKNRAATQQKITDLEPKRVLVDMPGSTPAPNASAQALVNAVTAKLALADAHAAKADFTSAETTRAAADSDADQADVKLAALKVSLDALVAMQTRIDAIKSRGPVELQLDIALEHIAAAKPHLDAGDTGKCDAEVTKASAAADAADAVLAGAKTLADDQAAASALVKAEVTAEDLAPLLVKATEGLAKVKGREAAMTGQTVWAKSIEVKLTDARKDPGIAAAQALADCLEMIKNANADAEQYKVFAAERKKVQDEATAIKAIATGGPWAQPELDDVTKYVALATDDADRGIFQSAFNQIRSAGADLIHIRQLADSYAAYDTRSTGATKTAIASVKTDTHRFAITDELDEIDSLSAKATAAIAARDAITALRHLDEIEALCALCKIKLEISKGETPDEAVLREMMTLDSGPDFLDKFVQELDPRINRKAMGEVTKARFGLDAVVFSEKYDNKTAQTTPAAVTELTKPAMDLRGMYDILKAVPDACTRDNPSLKRLNRYEQVDYSFYESAGKELAMRCGRVTDENHFAIGAEWEIDRTLLPGEVRDPKAELDFVVHDAPQPSYFSWQVWHELAHSIDDKLGFMAANQSQSKYGGWQVHGTNTRPIAEAAAAKFGCDNDASKTYIEKLLLGKTPDAPAETDMSEALRLDIHAWYEAIRTDNNIWDNGSATRKNALGERMYHEAYAGTWVSYDLKERATGVTGYQYRAPGEWFSEIYAAIKTGKLKSSHPAYAELTKY